ncbi:hotdog domain-containing protein [Sphaerisporangium sp. B11E5]|uniref:thioesterase family protein n=1 Tax=Sphaerisporangium sp. B11E5 TaxID=3153563 RepID=UPI00325C6868
MALVPGLAASTRIVVTDADTMGAMGTGELPVLALPRLLALADAAAVAAIAPCLEPGMTSAGEAVAIQHERPSPVGAEVVVSAELTEVDGRRLAFGFTARLDRSSGSPDGDEAVVATGTVERVLVKGTRSGDR